MYLLDADIFIKAKNEAYGLDFCPAFWDWLLLGHSRGFLGSVAAIKNELLAGQDELARWAKAAPSGFFLQPTSSVLGVLGQITNYIVSKGYPQAEQNRFYPRRILSSLPMPRRKTMLSSRTKRLHPTARESKSPMFVPLSASSAAPSTTSFVKATHVLS